MFRIPDSPESLPSLNVPQKIGFEHFEVRAERFLEIIQSLLSGIALERIAGHDRLKKELVLSRPRFDQPKAERPSFAVGIQDICPEHPVARNKLA